MYKPPTAARFLFFFLFYIVGTKLSAQVSISSFDTKNGSTSTVHSLTGIPAGALLVLTTSSGVGSNATCAVSSSPSLTWTKRVDAGGSNSGDAEIYTALFSAGGSISVTSNWGSFPQSSVCYVVTGQESTLGGAFNSGNSQQFPSVAVTSTRANSILFCVTSDWNAVSGTSRTYRSTPVTERQYYFSSNNVTGYHYTKDAPTVTSYTMGLTAPNMNNGGGTTVLEIRVDATAPTSSLSSPAAGNVSGTINVNANATDDATVAGVQFLLDGNNLGSEDVTSPYSVSWNTTTASNGSHTLTARARDAAGNTTTSSGVVVTVDNTDTQAPAVSITAPAAGNVSATINVDANASDNVGVVGVQFLIDGNNLGSEDLTSPYSVSWNTTTATNGNHTLTARARDAAGNTTTSSGVVVSVSNAASESWLILGNNGTNPTNNFIGTIDNQPLKFRTYNQPRMTLDETGNLTTVKDIQSKFISLSEYGTYGMIKNIGTSDGLQISSTGRINFGMGPTFGRTVFFNTNGDISLGGGSGEELSGIGSNNGTNSLIFKTNGALSVAPVEKMRLTNTGNLLIGKTTDEGQRFQLLGDLKVSTVSNPSGPTDQTFAWNLRSYNNPTSAGQGHYTIAPYNYVTMLPKPALLITTLNESSGGTSFADGSYGAPGIKVDFRGYYAAGGPAIEINHEGKRNVGVNPIYGVRATVKQTTGNLGTLYAPIMSYYANATADDDLSRPFAFYGDHGFNYFRDAVGIGMEPSPSTNPKLTVYGSGVTVATFRDVNYGHANIQVENGNGYYANFGVEGSGIVSLKSNNTVFLYGNLAGKVGIGTSNLADNNFKLFVATGIRTQKVKVDPNNWSDYVFESGYKLPTLKEVEEFINKNKHLPDVPSAKEVEKNGLDVGDNQAVLLKKIEELTLYMIELNKKVDKLSEENASLKKKLEAVNK